MAEETIILPSVRTEFSNIQGWVVSHVLPESWFEDDPVSRTLVFCWG